MKTACEAIVIGASAGGIATLREVISQLPRGFRIPILVVQHIHPGSSVDFSLVFRNDSRLHVKEAEDKERIVASTVYIAPPGYHLLVEKQRTLALTVDPAVNFARPSIDVLFETAVEAYASALVGVVLTGANHDGAQGVKAIKRAGGTVVVEDPKTAAVPTMPEAAIQEIAADFILPAAAIGKLLASWNVI